MTVRIVTDGAVQFLDPSVTVRDRITVLPRTVTIGNQSYYEPDSLNMAEFIRAAERGNNPIVSAPSVEDFRDTYLALARETGEIISIHNSQALDAACSNARAAAQSILGRCNVHILDSRTTSFTLGYLVEQVARAAVAGQTFDELIRLARRQVTHLYALFYTESLTALQTVHALSEAHAIMSEMLDLRMLVEIEDGQFVISEKTRARPQGFNLLMDFIQGFHADDHLIIVSPAAGQEAARTLQMRIASELGWIPPPMRGFNSTLGTALGNNSVGVLVCQSPDARISAVSDNDDD